MLIRKTLPTIGFDCCWEQSSVKVFTKCWFLQAWNTFTHSLGFDGNLCIVQSRYILLWQSSWKAPINLYFFPWNIVPAWQSNV